MKYMLEAIIVPVLLSFFFRASIVGDQNTRSFFALKKVSINFTCYGNKSGTVRLVIKDSGKWILREEESESSNAGAMKVHSLQILTPDSYYDIDLISKKGFKQPNIASSREFYFLKFPEVLDNDTAAMFEEEKKFVKEEAESIAGVVCQVVQDQELGHRLWFWNGIFLKTRWGKPGDKSYGIVAKSVDQQADIPQTLFVPPPYVEIK